MNAGMGEGVRKSRIGRGERGGEMPPAEGGGEGWLQSVVGGC